MKNKKEHSYDEKEESCCCHHHEEEIKEEQACCCSEKSEPKDENNTCCCSGSEERKAENSDCCCSVKEEKQEQTSCCCSSEEQKKEDNNCCCSHSEEKEEIHSSSCCCSVEEEKHEKTHSSCCCSLEEHEDDDNEMHTCCSGPETKHKRKNASLREWIYIIVSALGVIASFVIGQLHLVHKSGNSYWGILDPAWISIIILGYPLFVGAYYGLKNKKITSALLVSMAMLASIIMGFLIAFGVGSEVHTHGSSYFFAAGEIALLMAIGQKIEKIIITKSRTAIKQLIEMRPSIVHLKTNNGYKDVAASTIDIGDVVVVRPNEIVSIDGIVENGESAIDTSSITGEYVPVDAYKGTVVYAGTRNLFGSLEIIATKKTSETTLSKLVEYVKESEKKKAPIVKIADKWASYLVVTSLALAVIAFFVVFFGLKTTAMGAIQRSIAILVVFCPCALALATPIAISAAVGNLGRKGILVRSGIALEAVGKTDVVAFDKTGTVTEGKIRVDEIFPYEIDKEQLLKYVATAELYSEHPIAKAIVEEYKKQYSGDLIVDSSESIMGKGIKAKAYGKTIEVLKVEEITNIPDSEKVKITGTGKTAIGVLVDGAYKGLILLSDVLRPGIKEVIEKIKAMGIQTLMLTGDNNDSAKAVAEELGINTYYSSLLPEDKARKIEELTASGKKVLMIGDGVNDAPSMVAATASMAIGAMGSSVAMNTADISILGNDMSRIRFLLKLSRKTISVIHINITISLLISFTSIILSVLGYVNAAIGALIHNASSVIVCLHSARLLMKKENKTK